MRARFRAVVSAGLAVVLGVSLLAAPAHAEDGETPASEREAVVSLLATAGPSVRRAAEVALLGSDADLRAFIDSGRAVAQEADDRAAAQVLVGMDGPAVRQAALDVLEHGSAAAIRAFVDGGWRVPWGADERLRVTRVLDSGGVHTRQAASQALAGTAEDWSEFLASGRQAAQLAADRLMATTM
jgi:hypothetical protein